MILIYHFDEVADDERYCLNALEFLLRADLFPLELLLIVLDELLLDLEELEVSLKLMQLLVLVVDLGLHGTLGRLRLQWWHFNLHLESKII